MIYTNDWFAHNGLKWIKWLRYFINKPDLNFLEIGCYEGKATVWLLEHILTHSTAKITAIDTFEGSMEHKQRHLDVSSMYANFMENTEKYRNKVIVCKGYSQQILRSLSLNSFDFIYVDGSHQATDVLEDTILSWRLLKSGGVLIWDDYAWGKGFNNDLMTPKLAIDAFLLINKGNYYLIAKERQVCVIKL